MEKINWKYVMAGLLVLIVGMGYLLLSGGSPGTKENITAVMLMRSDSFEPVNLEIKKGTKVEFKNMDSQPHWPASDLHPTHGIYPEFDPKQPVNPGESWSFVFDRAGKWRYHDHLVPSIRGIITVSD